MLLKGIEKVELKQLNIAYNSCSTNLGGQNESFEEALSHYIHYA
jgi:hypothetical protein